MFATIIFKLLPSNPLPYSSPVLRPSLLNYLYATIPKQLLSNSVTPASHLVFQQAWHGNQEEGVAGWPCSNPLSPEHCFSVLLLLEGFPCGLLPLTPARIYSCEKHCSSWRFFRPNEPSEALVSLHLRALTLEPILGWHYEYGKQNGNFSLRNWAHCGEMTCPPSHS